MRRSKSANRVVTDTLASGSDPKKRKLFSDLLAGSDPWDALDADNVPRGLGATNKMSNESKYKEQKALWDRSTLDKGHLSFMQVC